MHCTHCKKSETNTHTHIQNWSFQVCIFWLTYIHPKHSSLTFATYTVAEDQQHIGIARIVCDLHEGDKGKVMVGETLSKVIGNKDPESMTSRHFSCQDHLQAKSIMHIIVVLHSLKRQVNVVKLQPENLMRTSLTFPEFSGPMAMPNSDLMKVLLIRLVTSWNVFP